MKIRRLKSLRWRYPVLPALVTLANGTCGLVSIAVSSTARPELGETWASFYAGVLIYLGMLFDGLDGHVARAAKQESDFGIQLDSLCDAITFGVAPVFLMVNLSDVFHLRFLWGIGVMFSLCVLLRLARFNVEAREGAGHDYFRGLPSPAAAGTIASFAVAMPALLRWSDASMPELVQEFARRLIDIIVLGMPLLTLVLACLMVSRVRYPHLLNQWLRGRRNFYRLSQLMFVVVAVLTIHELALPLVFCVFSFGHPISALCSKSVLPVARRLLPPR